MTIELRKSASAKVIKAAICALDDENDQAAVLYLQASDLFRQVGDVDWANETARLAADCLDVLAEAA